MIPFHLTEYVEKSIQEIGLDPFTSRGKKDGQWTIKYKNSTVWIDVFNYTDNPDKYYLQVMSPLCKLPDRKADEFATDLLEINYLMYGSWMCKRDNWIYVLSLREADNLQKAEVDAAVDRVAIYSSDYWGKLSFKYKGCWDEKPGAEQAKQE